MEDRRMDEGETRLSEKIIVYEFKVI